MLELSRLLCPMLRPVRIKQLGQYHGRTLQPLFFKRRKRALKLQHDVEKKKLRTLKTELPK